MVWKLGYTSTYSQQQMFSLNATISYQLYYLVGLLLKVRAALWIVCSLNVARLAGLSLYFYNVNAKLSLTFRMLMLLVLLSGTHWTVSPHVLTS